MNPRAGLAAPRAAVAALIVGAAPASAIEGPPRLSAAEINDLRERVDVLNDAWKRQRTENLGLHVAANLAAHEHVRTLVIDDLRRGRAAVQAYDAAILGAGRVGVALEAVGMLTDSSCAIAAPRAFDQAIGGDGLTVSQRLGRAIDNLEKHGALNPAPAGPTPKAARPKAAAEVVH